MNHFYDFFVLYVLVSKSRFLWRSSIFFQRETMTNTETRHVSLSNHKFNWCCIEQKYQIVSLRIQFLKNIWVEPAKKLVASAQRIAIGWECLSWFLNQCDLLLSFYFIFFCLTQPKHELNFYSDVIHPWLKPNKINNMMH